MHSDVIQISSQPRAFTDIRTTDKPGSSAKFCHDGLTGND